MPYSSSFSLVILFDFVESEQMNWEKRGCMRSSEHRSAQKRIDELKEESQHFYTSCCASFNLNVRINSLQFVVY